MAAKNENPTLFHVLLAAYELECKAQSSPKDAANVILSLVKNKEFSNEPELWNEVERLLKSDTSEQNAFRAQIMIALGPKNHRELIIEFANKQKDITKNVDMMLRLIDKWPEHIQAVGPQLTEKLLQEEKCKAASQSFSPLNECRTILVNRVLPVLSTTRQNLNLQPKNYYKWFQKSIEYTTSYTTTTDKRHKIPSLTDPWGQLRKLRIQIGKQNSWVDEPTHPNLLENVNWLTGLYSQRPRGNQDISLRKQMFYTAVHLHLEAAANYMSIVEPCVVSPPDGQPFVSQFPVHSLCTPLWKNSDSEPPKNERHELFQASLIAHRILVQDVAFSADLAKLEKTWRSETWFWYKLYSIDKSIEEKNFDQAVRLLSNIIKSTDLLPRVSYRCRVQLGSCYYALQKVRSSVRPFIEAVLLPQPDTVADDSDVDYIKDNTYKDVAWLRAIHEDVLPLSVHAFLEAIEQQLIQCQTDKPKQMKILGWMLVLSQFEWPRFSSKAKMAVDKIQRESEFSYPNLLDYIYEGSIAEEFAWLLNQDIKLEITSDNRSELRNQLVKTVQLSMSPVKCIREFLSRNKEEILSLVELIRR